MAAILADDIFKWIFLNENVIISIEISLKSVPKGPINNIPALVQIMAWRRPGNKPLSGPMMVRLPTHICVSRPQWVKSFHISNLQNPQEDTANLVHTSLYVVHIMGGEYFPYACNYSVAVLLPTIGVSLFMTTDRLGFLVIQSCVLSVDEAGIAMAELLQIHLATQSARIVCKNRGCGVLQWL